MGFGSDAVERAQEGLFKPDADLEDIESLDWVCSSRFILAPFNWTLDNRRLLFIMVKINKNA